MFMTRNHQRRAVGAFAACLVALTLTMAQPEAIQGVRFTATASGPTGELGPVEIVINRFFSTVVEKRLMTISTGPISPVGPAAVAVKRIPWMASG